MGFFNNLLGVKKVTNNQELIAILKGVDFVKSAKYISDFLQNRKIQAEEKRCYLAAKSEIMNDIKQYWENPCLERAITLLKKNPDLLPMFEMTKDPFQTWGNNFKKRNGLNGP
jgi:hypothetical protein